MEPHETVSDETESVSSFDALGARPSPLNGGKTAYLQLGANSARLRAAFAAIGVTLLHAVFLGKIWNMLKECDAESRVKRVADKEKANKVEIKVLTQAGKKVLMVTLPGSEKPKSLDETRAERAELTSIPEEELAKVDEYRRLEVEKNQACEKLRESKHECFAEVISLVGPLLEALDGRAAEYAAQAAETDKGKLNGLRESAENEKRFVKEKLKECRTRTSALDAELVIDEKTYTELRNKAVHLTLSDEPDQEEVNTVALKRRLLWEAIKEKKAERATLGEVIGQYKTDMDKLETQIENFTNAINGETPAKKQKAK